MSAHDEHDHEQDRVHHDTHVSAIRSSSLSILGGGGADPWRSIEERAGSSDLQAAARHEFPKGADQLDGVSRRNFVQLLGASLAVSGGAACYRPNQPIVPYVRRPPEVTPGNPLHFATAFALEGFGHGLVVESHAGRPTKIEGNADHPDSGGAASVIDQALVQGLYDNDRSRQIRWEGQPVAWRTALAAITEMTSALETDGGAKLRFLVEPSTSPLVGDLKQRILRRFPKAKFVYYSPVASDGALEGARLAFGRPLDPRHDLGSARVILSLDDDFLADGPEQLRLHREFSAHRVPGAAMNRLYVAEPCPTVTGGMADHRLRVRGSEVIAVAQAVLVELAKQPGLDGLAPLASLPKAQPQVNVDARWVAAVAKDLAKNRGKCVIFAGRRQPAALHALVHAMNIALGNAGSTVTWRAALRDDPQATMQALQDLASDIAAGNVDVLVITARNPVYGAPADFQLDKILGRAGKQIYMAPYEDETAALTSSFIPEAHVLESWGDTRGIDGTVSLIQPLIAPLWSGLTEVDLLAAFVGDGDKGAHALLKQYWQKRATAEGWSMPTGFDSAWEGWLSRGSIERTAANAEGGVTTDPTRLAVAIKPLLGQGPHGGGLEVAFAVDPKIYDGRFANNAWLQELPHPITKITWDNAVLISQSTAQKLQLTTADVVRIDLGDRSVSGPLYVQPGHADDAITLSLGYGRKGGEAIARGVGFRAGVLRASTGFWFARGAALTKTTTRRYKFGITQDHWRTEDRDPAMSTTLEAFTQEGSPVRDKLEMRRHPLPNIQGQEPVDYSGQAFKWAMAIDLSKCSGCNACIIACQSENNIPVVGRDNVRIGREMHWIRLDRYYVGDIENPEIVHQPSACVHCETAPCEYVCPVNATVHSDEGLNEMVYNRCIGTRYCSNNCPYKARRFNFLDYYDSVPAVKKMNANPDVTVRSRGVMEKCTYCVQRIERSRIDARVEGRTIRDGDVVTACQQGCPANAIEFGSLNERSSRVSKAHADDRRYNLLHELGTRPRTAYLARIRNPNPELA